MNDAIATADGGAPAIGADDEIALDGRGRLALYLAVGLGAGAVIALQIDIMRVFSVGSWAHFGSLVVSLAMLGFGLTSAVMCVAKDWFAAQLARRGERRARPVRSARGRRQPLRSAARLQRDLPGLRSRAEMEAAEIFLASLTPFLAGAVFLGVVFLKSNRTFGRVYFADLAGSGLCGLVVLLAMYALTPANLIAAPLALWFAACLAWAFGPGGRRAIPPYAALALIAFGGHFLAAPALGLSRLAVNDYKGVAYARKFPDAQKVYENASPFGLLEAYSSSYLHFAPGLSDNAGFNLPEMPANAYLALYIDSDGPIGIIRDLPAKDTAYFRFLPMYYPYVIKKAPKTFITQFGGGISTALALRSGAKDVTVAEGNRAVLAAFRDPAIRDFTGDILGKARVIDYEGRHFLAQTKERFDVVDLSLADSVGLSNPGGFAIVEKFAYTQEAMETYMRALADGGVLSVTLWNKEEPPKSVLKLYTTMAAAARDVDGAHIADSFFVSSILSLDRDGALQARRFHRRRNRQAAQAHARDVVRRDLLAGALLRRLADRPHARRLRRADLFGRRRRSAGAVRGAGRDRRRRDGPRRFDRAAGRRPARRRRRRRRASRHRHGPARLAYADQRRLAGGRRALRLQHAQADQRPRRISRLTSRPRTCRASSIGSSCCRTNGDIC